MKYTYYGMTIPEYCAKHNLSTESIYARIKYLKNKNPNMNPKKIMKIVFGNERLTKYTYHGMSIKEYCEKNNVSSEYLYRQIEYLKTLNPNLNPKELLKLVIEAKDLIKFTYQGKPLAEYCAEHNLSFKTICNRFYNLKKEKPDLSTEELINSISFQKNLNYNVKYTYQGISLYEYCNKNKISIFTIYARIKKIAQEKPNLSTEELIKEALNRNFNEEKIMYFWNNTTLEQFCRNHPELNVSTIRGWVRNELSKNPHQSIEELINAYLNGLNNKNRWFYLGIPLKNFCDNNDISYNSIRGYLFKMLRNPVYSNWTDKELVSYLVERRFRINGKFLKDYCNSINFPYETMHLILKEKIKQCPNTKFKTILISIITTINNYRLINYQTIKHFPEEINNYLKNSTNNYLRHKSQSNESTLTLTR